MVAFKVIGIRFLFGLLYVYFRRPYCFQVVQTITTQSTLSYYQFYYSFFRLPNQTDPVLFRTQNPIRFELSFALLFFLLFNSIEYFGRLLHRSILNLLPLSS